MKIAPQPSGLRSRRYARSGFSLLEMVCVLALMALCAGMLTPGLARRLSRMNGAAEATRLETLAQCLVRHVEIHQEIPGASTWVSMVAAQSGLPEIQVRQVLPQDDSTTRVYLIHPGFSPRVGKLSPSSDTLWRQGGDGTATVSEARLIILGVHRPGLRPPVSDGFARSAIEFENIWEWTQLPTSGAPPRGWPSEWEGNGEYLHIARVNLAPLFQRVTFSNTQNSKSSNAQSPKSSVGVQIGMEPVTAMASGGTFDTLYLRGTPIRLYDSPEPSGRSWNLQLVHTLREGVNFVYADDHWQIP